MLEIVVVLVLAAVSYILWTSLEVSIDHRPDRTTILIWRETSRNSGGQGPGEAGRCQRPSMSGRWAGGWPRPQQPTASTTAEHDELDDLLNGRTTTLGVAGNWPLQMDDNEHQGGLQGSQSIPTQAPSPPFIYPPGRLLPPPRPPASPPPESSPCPQGVPLPQGYVPQPSLGGFPSPQPPLSKTGGLPQALTPEQLSEQSTETIAALLRDGDVAPQQTGNQPAPPTKAPTRPTPAPPSTPPPSRSQPLPHLTSISEESSLAS